MDYKQMTLKTVERLDEQLSRRASQLEPIGIFRREDIIGVLSLRNVPSEAVQKLELVETIQKAKIQNLEIVCPEGNS